MTTGVQNLNQENPNALPDDDCERLIAALIRRSSLWGYCIGALTLAGVCLVAAVSVWHILATLQVQNWVSPADCGLVGLHIGDPFYSAENKLREAAPPLVQFFAGNPNNGYDSFTFLAPLHRSSDITVSYSSNGIITGVTANFPYDPGHTEEFAGPSWSDLLTVVGTPPDYDTAKPDSLTGQITNTWPGYVVTRNAIYPDGVLSIGLRPECAHPTGQVAAIGASRS